ncbi:MAG: septal ring lytic transglycosylase RlpA family protein [Aquificaceae bacterium]|nr:septal ring lytic transglycosylase RlpA family protein [Aquificaceae bacterium]MDW8237180.1 septal ring lytic transglycosylase RlpA family protein [Aquificaceae bacterium]
MREGILLALALSSCAPLMSERETSVNCPKELSLLARPCPSERALASNVQSGSKIRVLNPSNGKSATLAVYKDQSVLGLCLPERVFNYLSTEPFQAQIQVLRCGLDDSRYCPKVIKGLASYYAHAHHGRKTAYGIEFDMHGLYAASKDVPLGSELLVRNLKNNLEVKVKVIDRGPFKPGRVLDLSYEAARRINMLKDGVVQIEAHVLRCGD